MNNAESIEVYNAMAEGFPDAVQALVISVDDNTDVTTTGICPGYAMPRSIVRGGIRTNTDARVYVLAGNVFSGVTDTAELIDKTGKLAGRTITIGTGDYAKAHRIAGAVLHGCKGVIIMQVGEYDRVVA